MLFQFFVISWVICTTVYKIVGVSGLLYVIAETSLRMFCSSTLQHYSEILILYAVTNYCAPVRYSNIDHIHKSDLGIFMHLHRKVWYNRTPCEIVRPGK